LAKETFDAIRKTELQTEQAEKEACTQADQIVQKAKEDAQVLLAETEKSEKLKQAQALQAAKKQGASMLQEQQEKTNRQISSLQAMADEKKADAVHTVLEELCG
jgi:vacuolar-type H+-ATPase subunit H